MIPALEKNPAQNQPKLSGWRLRFKNGVSSASDGELEDASRWLSHAEIFFGGVVAFGILLEFALALLHPPYDSGLGRFGPVIGDAFVGFGIVLEIVASSRERLCEGELRDRSNKQLGEAIKLAGAATERAAIAGLEVEKLRAYLSPRVVTADQFAQIKTLRGRLDALTLVPASDNDCLLFSAQLGMAFREAGVQTTESRLPPGAKGTGVVLYIPKVGDRGMYLPAGKELERVLLATGILTGGTMPQVHIRDVNPEFPALLIFERMPLPFPEPPFFGGPKKA